MLIFVAKIVKKLNSLPKNKRSVCIVSEQLASGGAERCAAMLSFFLENNDFEVHHLISIDKVEYPFSGSLFNMGLLKKNNSKFDKIFRFRKMYQFFRQNKFDYIVDSRVKHHFIQEFIIAKFIYNAPLILWVHSFMTHLYFPKSRFFSRLMYSKSQIVTVSNKIKTKLETEYGFKNVSTIYNPIDFQPNINNQNNQEAFDYDYILAAGSLKNNIKQFDVLISCFKYSILPSKNIKLLILGDGILMNDLKIQVQDLQLQDNVLFLGRQQNPFHFYEKALFTVLTSKNEGFPMVLLESLASGTPVVSFDCDSGPSELIQDRQNGLLVENQNQQEMIVALNEMVENQKLYLLCKANSKESVSSFSLDKIGKKWLSILK